MYNSSYAKDVLRVSLKDIFGEEDDGAADENTRTVRFHGRVETALFQVPGKRF